MLQLHYVLGSVYALVNIFVPMSICLSALFLLSFLKNDRAVVAFSPYFGSFDLGFCSLSINCAVCASMFRFQLFLHKSC